LYEGYKNGPSGGEFEAYFIISENNQGGEPSQTFCRQLRTQYGLTMPVLRDVGGAFMAAMNTPPNHNQFVFGAENRIVFYRQGDNTAWRRPLETELAR
jgi:hypothetical protein